jgi:hypothetical protein
MAENRLIPPTRLLKIDLDITVDNSWLEHYRCLAGLILAFFGLQATVIRIVPSRNRGYHVSIYLDKFVPAGFANMLQWLLLDDHGRVDFDRARINVGFPEWCKFFEAPAR